MGEKIKSGWMQKQKPSDAVLIQEQISRPQHPHLLGSIQPQLLPIWNLTEFSVILKSFQMMEHSKPVIRRLSGLDKK